MDGRPGDPVLNQYRYCGTCRLPLETSIHPDGARTYRHFTTQETDAPEHEPWALPLAEVVNPVIECDVCGEPAVCAFTVDGSIRYPNDPTDWAGHWAACEICAGLIEAKKVRALLAQALMSLDPEHRTERTEALLRSTYIQLVNQRTGRRIRLPARTEEKST